MWHTRSTLLLCAFAGTLALSVTTASAEANEERRVSFTGGADVYNKYFFRGILEEDDGFIFQPWAELSFNLYESDTPLTGLDLTLGTWNSLHSEAPGRGPFRGYETDFYSVLGATLFDDFDAALIYTAYLSPTGQFDAVEELALGVSYDDARLWNDRFALNPHVLIAKQVGGGRDAYLELGVTPGYEHEVVGQAIGLSFPVVVGLSLDDYYVTDAGDETLYGYTQAGVVLSIPLSFVSPAYGEWTLETGAHYLHLGQAARQANDGDNHEFIGSVGVSLGF